MKFTLEIDDLTFKIEKWARDKNLHQADPSKQTLKLGEEFGELCEGLAKGRKDLVKDSIGDMYVVMTILAMQLNLNIEECISAAYEEIKDRKGKMINGVSVKEADLDLCPHRNEWDDCPDCRH
ncbi:MazG-like family protein [Cytobacillus horneckiae]|uniref:MazG-like family protein n=1 Tax=Cytobacillus horneckiae TaxID=549687 RepID=UPI003D9AAE2D